MPRHIAILALAGALIGCGATPRAVTPQRPTFSSDTSTTAVGTVELESGIAIDPGDTLDTPLTLKIGTSETSEIFVSWSPYQWVERPGSDGNGVGDTTIGTRQRLFEETPEGRPSGAIQLAAKLPTADESEGLGSGEIDFTMAGIVSKSYEQFSATAFYQLGFLGEPGDDDIDLEHGPAIALSASIDDSTAIFGELAARIIPEYDQEQLFTTFGVAHALADHFVVDCAIVIGLSNDAPDYQILFGFTKNFGEIAQWFRADEEQ